MDPRTAAAADHDAADGSAARADGYNLRRAMTDWFSASLRRRLALMLALALGLPWLVGDVAKRFVQPGLHNDAQRGQQLIDFMVLGGMGFGLTLVATWLIGVWVTAVMKGPALNGDAFPAERPQAGADEVTAADRPA